MSLTGVDPVVVGTRHNDPVAAALRADRGWSVVCSKGQKSRVGQCGPTNKYRVRPPTSFSSLIPWPLPLVCWTEDGGSRARLGPRDQGASTGRT
jgi:hypothetical protein